MMPLFIEENIRETDSKFEFNDRQEIQMQV